MSSNTYYFLMILLIIILWISIWGILSIIGNWIGNGPIAQFFYYLVLGFLSFLLIYILNNINKKFL